MFFLFTSHFVGVNHHAHAIEYQSPRVMSLGGASRAGPVLNDSTYLNPSFASFTPLYTLFGGWTSFDKKRNYSVSVQDTRTELFQAGLAFTRREQNAAITIGASKKIIDGLSVGIGSKIIIDDFTNAMTQDMTLSTSLIMIQDFNAAFVVDNLLQSKSGAQRNLYRTFTLGTKYKVMDVIHTYVDPHYSPSYSGGKKAGFGAGAEVSLLSDFAFRLGRFVNSEVPHLHTRGNGYSFGGGWVGPRLTVDYAFHRTLEVQSGSGAGLAHAASFTVFF